MDQSQDLPDVPAMNDPSASYYLQYTVPEVQGMSTQRFLSLEHSLRNHPQLRHLTILPPPIIISQRDMDDQEREAFNAMLAERSKEPKMALDPNHPEFATHVAEVVKDRFDHNHGFSAEIDLIGAACRSTPEFAWALSSGVALCAYDEGVDVPRANRLAARFMHLIFKCDITKIEHYVNSQQAAVANDQEFEQGVMVATDREGFYTSFSQYWNAVRESTGVAPALAPFAHIDRGTLEFPIAYQFAPPVAAGQPIRIRYLHSGKPVQDALDRVASEGLSTEPTLPSNGELIPQQDKSSP